MSTLTASPTVRIPRPRTSPTRPAAGVRRPARTQVRLTRRGRLVVFLAGLFLVLGAALFLGATSVATGESGGAEEPTRVVMVGQGDTLWAIASAAAGDGDVRDMMHEIKELNALDSSMLVSGQTLFVPVTD
jgi:LysM repeat protein